jgi:hypothetical protein
MKGRSIALSAALVLGLALPVVGTAAPLWCSGMHSKGHVAG